ncbi:MAG: hypothetical protein LBJ74_04710 [Heliobacteriaceae bacterium]|jgi:hypothetical protein|nr:hypothetical protein [Heliobacteriaceae bacterium]
MAISFNTSSIISTLGNPEALLPLAIKDTATSLSLTHFAKTRGGDVEGGDRFIDEIGTMIIWLGGIPFFRGLINKTVYKAASVDPEIDVRVLKSKQHKSFAQKYATGNVAESIGNAVKNEKKVAGMFYGRFAGATVLALGAYLGLTALRQHFTRKKSEEKAYKTFAMQNFTKQMHDKNMPVPFMAFKNEPSAADKNNGNTPAFGGLTGKGLQVFMFDDALNTSIIDASILGVRLERSRNNSERAEYLLKDAFNAVFLYVFAHLGQSKVDAAFNKVFKKPVNLDARVLDSKDLTDTLNNKAKFEADMAEFEKFKNSEGILEFLQKNPDNIITKASKLSGTAATHKDKTTIDARKFIKTEKVEGIAQGLKELMGSAKGSQSLNKFVKSTRNLKIASILTGYGICFAALGYVMPKLLYDVLRKRMNKGENTFHVENDIINEVKERLAKQA